MLIIPAIDLLDGRVVRLIQGEESKATVYSDNPLDVALEYQDSGAVWIHVVDLDGAFGRTGKNDALIERLTKSLSIPIELGGGIRSIERMQFWLDRAVGRVVIGTAAIKNPALVETAVRMFGNDSLVAGIDIRNKTVSVSGWKEDTELGYLELSDRMKNAGLSRVVVTDIATDGMLSGPRLEAMIAIAEKTGLFVIASGGIGTLKDLASVSDESERGIEGAIVGKALYERRFTLREAVEQFQKKGKGSD